MLKIVEVDTENQLNTLLEARNNSFDYLYVLKYNGQFLLSDNGKLINMNTNNGSSNSINNSNDVNITNIQNGQILAWDSSSNKFVNINNVSSETITTEQMNAAINQTITALNIKEEENNESGSS